MQKPPRTVEQHLFEEPYAFDFFQAVRLLRQLAPDRGAVGLTGKPRAEAARFRAYLSLNFPPSAIYDLEKPREPGPPPLMTVAFLGLYGPSGMLPRHYTEMLLRSGTGQELRIADRDTLRAFLDLFNHRLVSLFYRAWEKYRFHPLYERGTPFQEEPDPFTLGMFSFVGLGMKPLRERLHVVHAPPRRGPEFEPPPRKKLASIDDFVLLFYGGLFSQKPRNVSNLRAILEDYFDLPVRVEQFRGQWLPLGVANMTKLGEANAALGQTAVAGERVWDVQGKIRLRVGPLRRAQFDEFLPDRAPVEERKAFFLLVHLARLFLGPELDFDVQLVLAAEDVPECKLDGGAGLGPRLGWNTWLTTRPMEEDAGDAVFEGVEVFQVS